MAKRTYIKFFGKCQVKKIERPGKNIRVTMKCPNSFKKKIKSAQEVIDSS